jgi:polysaccharide biosynthesis protein PslG
MSMDARFPKRADLAVALLLLCLLALACLAPAGRAARSRTAQAPPAHPLGGLNIAGLEYDSTPGQATRSIALARALHAQVVRVDLPWAVLEPRGANLIDPHALAFTDRLVADAASAGMRVILFADSSPCWASSAPASLLRACIPGRSSTANAWPPANPTDYAALVGYLANRYGSRLAAIEVWNEPDQANELHFAGPDKPRRYAAILRAAYPAIKRSDPQLPVLAGSLVGSNGVFLRSLYAAGIKGYYDGLAVHFYHLTLASLRSIHEVQLANGDTKPLWLDEFGWSSCYPLRRTQQEQSCVTQATQGTNLANLFRSLARTPYVAAEVVYKLQDSPGESFGSLTSTGAHKPAFAMLSGVLASPFGRVSRIALTLHRRGGRVLASGSGPVGDFMGLEVLQQGLPRFRALFVLDRFNRYSIVLPRVLGTSGLLVRVYQYWTGLTGATQRGI